MTALFVSGTGTGVGKTWCTVQLVRAASARGVRAAALKPVVSGYDDAAPRGSDTAELLAALGMPLSDESAARVSPWRFREPLAPDMAARREGRRIAFEDLVGFCERSARDAELTLVEGVGGIMVPLDDTHTVLDWIAALAAPVVLVAGSYLGTLSHTLTAVLALRTRGCELAAVLVSESPAQPVPLEETARTIERFLPALCAGARPPPVAVVPRGGTHENVAIFAELVERYGRGSRAD